jgi:hypothetical protein
MINLELFSMMRKRATQKDFVRLIHPTERLRETQGLMDFITRFLVFNHVKYSRTWDVEEYLDNGTMQLADLPLKELEKILSKFDDTLSLLISLDEPDILRPFRDGAFKGRVGQAAFETIFLGVSANLKTIGAKAKPKAYVIERVKELWSRKDVAKFTRAGLRGTDRIRATIPFGQKWFAT